VNHYLSCFRQLLICCLLSAIFYCRLCLLKVHMESSSLLLLPSLVEDHACRLLLQALFTKSSHRDSSLLLFSSLVEGHACQLLLQPSFTKSSHSWFLGVTWHGESLCRLGVQGFGFLLLLGGFFLPSVAQHFSKIFDLQSSHCLLPPSRHNLGSSSDVVK
jgi:hypothetical protein